MLATAVSAFTLPGGSTRINNRHEETSCTIDEYDRRKSYEVNLDDSQSDIYQLRELGDKATDQDETATRQTSTKIDSFRVNLSQLVSSRELEVFITFCIVANTVVMATEHYGMSSTLEAVISVSNYVSS